CPRAATNPNHPGLLCRVPACTTLDERLGDCRRIPIGGQFFRCCRVDHGLWHPWLVVSRGLYRRVFIAVGVCCRAAASIGGLYDPGFDVAAIPIAPPASADRHHRGFHRLVIYYPPVARGGHRHISHHWDTGLAWPSDRHLGGLTHCDYRWDALGYRCPGSAV